MKKLSFQIAFGGIVTALCIIMMFLVAVFPALVYVFPMLSSVLIFILNYECGSRTAVISYASVSLLSLILSPDKESALLFMFFVGYYPILNRYIDRLRSRLLQWVIRFALFNASIVTTYFILIKLFVAVELEDFGEYTAPVLLALANVTLVCYDLMLRSIQMIYVKRLRKKLFRRK